MIRLLAIPVAGTVAALVVILLAHPEREADAADQPPRPEVAEPPLAPPEPPPVEPPEAAPPEDAAEGKDEKPPPPPRELQLELAADGSFVDLESGETYADLDELRALGEETRHRLVLTNADGVGREALEAAEAALRDRFEVRRIYREPPEED